MKWLLVSAALLVTLFIAYQFVTPEVAPIATPDPVEEAEEKSGVPKAEVPAVSSSPENTVVFHCQNGSLTVVFVRDIAGVTLSDGRQFELRETRPLVYENQAQKVTLLGGSEARFLEDGTATYTGCQVEP